MRNICCFSLVFHRCWMYAFVNANKRVTENKDVWEMDINKYGLLSSHLSFPLGLFLFPCPLPIRYSQPVYP